MDSVLVKRGLDIAVAGLAMVALSPLFIVIVPLLALTGEGEIFFKQIRIGKGEKEFALLKFATMLKDSPALLTGTVTIKDDPRVLPIGKTLRSTKINELPQIYNILIGEMSFVGPRPQTRRCFDAFPEESKRLISTARPGLTGVGSIIFRHEESILPEGSDDAASFYDEIVMPYKGKLEEWYVRNRSLTVDISCIFLTLIVIINPDSGLVWRIHRSLPAPPAELKELLNFNGR